MGLAPGGISSCTAFSFSILGRSASILFTRFHICILTYCFLAETYRIDITLPLALRQGSLLFFQNLILP